MSESNEIILMPDELEFICRHAFEIFKVPIHYVDSRNIVIFSYIRADMVNPLRPDFMTVFKTLAPYADWLEPLLFKTTPYMENFFIVKLRQSGSPAGFLVAGPVIQDAVSEKTIDRIMAEHNIHMHYKPDLKSYYHKCTIISYSMLINIAVFLYYTLYRIKLDNYGIIRKNSINGGLETNIEKNLHLDLSANRQNSMLHHTPQYEQQMLQHIKDGNTEKLFEYHNRMDGAPGTLSRGNPLRSRKNSMICWVTLVTRAAIEGGVNSELAFTLSDQYIQQLEEFNEISDVEELSIEMMHDFCNRVKTAKNFRFSKVVTQCRSYIFKHIYENIRLSDLAAHVNLNANYLSELFKKEAGITIHELIQKEKIEEAKRLLQANAHPLLDIAIQLNFCNQSHLTRIFRKHTGMTPRQYRALC